MQLDHSTLIEKLHYDPDTGVFSKRQGKNIGKPLGWMDKDGYRRISIQGTKVYAGRLAWFYVHAEWPHPTIDHLNGQRDDNRLVNLRPATRAEQKQNTHGAYKNNRTGYAGVIRRHNRFEAKIVHNRRPKSLGTFETPEEAHAAYVQAKQQIHTAWAP